MSIRRLISLHNKAEKKILVCMTLVIMLMMTAGFTRAGAPDNAHQVQIHVDGRTIELSTIHRNPEAILERAGVKLSAKDSYQLQKLDDRSTDITIYRAVPITIDYQGQKKEVLTSTRTVKDALLEQGYNPDDVTASPGMDAKIHSNMDIAVTDSAAAQATTEPEPAREQVETSYGMTPYSAVYTMEATAYLPWDGGGDGITASGMPAQYGIAAVDTDVIPLGTRLYIPGYGEAIAADTGGAIVGDRIDLCMEDYGQAMDFGRRYVTVYVLD